MDVDVDVDVDVDGDAAGLGEATRRLQAARDRSRELKDDAAHLAGKIADTEDRAAEVLEGAAAAHPDRRDHLEAMAAGARAFAARERAASHER